MFRLQPIIYRQLREKERNGSFIYLFIYFNIKVGLKATSAVKLGENTGFKMYSFSLYIFKVIGGFLKKDIANVSGGSEI